MPFLLRTIHNSPYYAQVPSSRPSLIRRDDALAGNASIAIIVIIIVALILVGIGFCLTRARCLTSRRSTASAGKSKITAKFGSGSLRPEASKNIRQAGKVSKTYQRFGSDPDGIACPKLPPASYVGLFQAASALERGEGVELDPCAHEDSKEVLRGGKSSILGRSRELKIIPKTKIVGASSTEEEPGFRPRDTEALFVIGEEEEEEAEEKKEKEDPRYTFNSDDLPPQWGKKKEGNGSDLTRPSIDSVRSTACSSDDFETRIRYTARSGQRSHPSLRFGITTRCYRHVNDSTEAMNCGICEALSMDFREA